MTMTTEEIEQCRSKYGGWDQAGLQKLGVQWPPVKGWRTRLLAGLDPNVEDTEAAFIMLENGRWHIKVPCHSREIIEGMQITVRRSDGTFQTVRVGHCLRQGSHYAICTFY